MASYNEHTAQSTDIYYIGGPLASSCNTVSLTFIRGIVVCQFEALIVKVVHAPPIFLYLETEQNYFKLHKHMST